MKERTLAIIKPDAIHRYLIGYIIQRIEMANLEIVDMKMIRMTKEQAAEFYKEHKDKPFFDGQTDFMSSGPCIMMVLEGENAIAKYRELIGATDKEKANQGTIRKELATDIRHNIVHGSDSKESANFEISFFNRIKY